MPKKKEIMKFEIVDANRDDGIMKMNVKCLSGKDSGKTIYYSEIKFIESDDDDMSVSFEYEVISEKNRKLKKEKYEEVAVNVLTNIVENSFQDLESKMEAKVGTTDS
jgi:hypothetical protein